MPVIYEDGGYIHENQSGTLSGPSFSVAQNHISCTNYISMYVKSGVVELKIINS